MQIKKIVIPRVKVNVMHDLTRFSARKLSMLPFATVALTTIAESMRLDEGCVRPVRLFGGRIDGRRCFSDFRNGRHHSVSAPFVFAARESLNLLGIHVKRVSMAMPHLVMANAHFSRGNRSITVLASAANYLPAPTIFGRSVFLNPLVMHKAKTICGVLSTATINAANLVKNWRSHGNPVSLWLPKFYHDKALGNSMAVPVMRWIAERIETLEAAA